MSNDLVIPEIHVQSQLIIDTVCPERCHITDNAFQGTIDYELRRQQIREYPEGIDKGEGDQDA